jgi:hypothetical protein
VPPRGAPASILNLQTWVSFHSLFTSSDTIVAMPRPPLRSALGFLGAPRWGYGTRVSQGVLSSGVLSPLRGWFAFHSKPTAHAVGYHLAPLRGWNCPLDWSHRSRLSPVPHPPHYLQRRAHLDTAPVCNGVATSSSPLQSHSQGDDDIAAPNPFQKGAVSGCALQRPPKNFTLPVGAGPGYFPGFGLLFHNAIPGCPAVR